MALEINDKGFLTDLRSLSRGGSNVATPFPRCAVRVCAIHSRRGAANESPPDRISSCRSPFYLTQCTEAFRQGLRELGYVEGKTIVIEWRFGEGKLDRLPALATELVRLNIDVIISGGPAPTRAAKEATKTIPIVMTNEGDPVGTGLVAGLARPGGNVTGFSTLSPELSGKRLELLKEIVPKLSRVAVFATSTLPGNAQALRETELAAGAFGVKLQYLDVLAPKDIEPAFRAAGKGRADAGLMMVAGGIASSQSKEIKELAVKSRLPVRSSGQHLRKAGGL
jgi:ABC-type uncharacterized transport system substrate-binding protein